MKPAIINTSRFLQRNLLWFLVLAYALGAIWPEAGLWIRGVPGGGSSGGWLLKAMLALLLLNAGLGLDTRQLYRLSSRATVLVTALATSVLVPGLYVLGLAAMVGVWGQTAAAQQIVLGLAVVAAMPAAASSTAWAQNAEGNLALSLGLLLLSTLLSPITALLILQAAAMVIESLALPEIVPLVSQVTAGFLALWVILPATAGVALRWLVGGARVDRGKPYVKLINLSNLLALNYANASLALPSVINRPEPLTLIFVIAATLGLAAVAFGAAQPVARWHQVDASQRASLLFAMGMRNNGAGLVLVATAVAQPGPVLLPIIVYNLVQHLAAAVVDRFVIPRNAARAGVVSSSSVSRGSLARVAGAERSDTPGEAA
jgi:BASS family bile acid:Na+ symporter